MGGAHPFLLKLRAHEAIVLHGEHVLDGRREGASNLCLLYAYMAGDSVWGPWSTTVAPTEQP
jgi:hypothetical protein